MTERIFFILIIHIVAALLLESIAPVHSKDCLISRNNRDLLTVFVNQTSCVPSNNPCYKFGSILVITSSQCVCICPASKPTYMESTNRCSAYKDVWSKCNLSFRRKYLAIPIFSTVFSTSLRLNIPKQFRSCKMEADRKNSFYLSGSGWNEVPQNYKFPFLVETRSFRKRYKLAYVKWKTKVPPELVGRVFRLGITCGKQSDCVTLKISGKAFDQCIPLPPTTMIPASSRPSSFIPSQSPTPTKYVITTVQQVIPSTHTRPSVTNNGRRDSSSSVKIPWSVIGTVIGILVVLLLCIVILAVCFWRRRKKLIQKNQNGNASTQSLGITLSSSGSQPEVTYASPHHHPYQELKPPVSGTPRATYQPLMRNAKEDSSGYMLPSESNANNTDPLYNEIGSPLRRTLPPVYDYALPENTVRISQHLSNTDLELNKLPNHNARNDVDYVGRTTQDQEDSENPSLEGAALAPLDDGLVSPSYIDFTCEQAPNQKDQSKSKNSDTKAPKHAPGSSRYKKPINVPKIPRKPVSAPKSPLKKSSPQEFTYRVLTSPSTPGHDEPLRLRETPEDGYNNDSTA